MSFEDGQGIVVQLRPRQRVEVRRPDHLNDELDSLKSQAGNGDAAVALALSRWLGRCNGRNFSSEAEFKHFLDQYQQTHILSIRIGNDVAAVRKAPTPLILDELRKDYEFCKGVPESEVAASQAWLESAAGFGNVDALEVLGRQHISSREGAVYLEAAWLAGSIDAASWLAKALATQEDAARRDLVGAYAYQLVYSSIVRADFEQRKVQDLPFNQAWMEADRAGLQSFGNQLTPGQIKLANALATRLLRENTNCCFARP